MILEQNKKIDIFLEMIKQLPENQLGELFDFAEYLVFKEKKLLERSNMNEYSENEYHNIVHELQIPTYSCEGMNVNFTRDDLYDNRI